MDNLIKVTIWDAAHSAWIQPGISERTNNLLEMGNRMDGIFVELCRDRIF